MNVVDIFLFDLLRDDIYVLDVEDDDDIFLESDLDLEELVGVRIYSDLKE